MLLGQHSPQKPKEAVATVNAYRDTLGAQSKVPPMQWAQQIEHSPKLVVLKQLLEDCGIGLGASGACDTPMSGVAAPWSLVTRSHAPDALSVR